MHWLMRLNPVTYVVGGLRQLLYRSTPQSLARATFRRGVAAVALHQCFRPAAICGDHRVTSPLGRHGGPLEETYNESTSGSRRIGRLLPVRAGGLTIFLATRTTWNRPEAAQVVSKDDPHPSGTETRGQHRSIPSQPFELTDQSGKTFNSESLAGKVWVGSIFFADCPSTCRVQNNRVAELQREFGDQGVEFVSITCDPANDTPARLAEYSRLFGADPAKWHFLTGDLLLIREIGNNKFGIVVEEEVHSDRLIVFDREGQVVGTYRSTQRDEFLKAQQKLRDLLASP